MREEPRYCLPIEHGVAKRTSRAASSEERIPHCVRKRLRLAIRREPDGPRSASETHRHDLALGLARHDVRPYGRTVGQICPGKRRIVCRVADLKLPRRQRTKTNQKKNGEMLVGCTYVCQVDRRLVPRTKEHVQKSEREDINGVVLIKGRDGMSVHRIIQGFKNSYIRTWQ